MSLPRMPRTPGQMRRAPHKRSRQRPRPHQSRCNGPLLQITSSPPPPKRLDSYPRTERLVNNQTPKNRSNRNTNVRLTPTDESISTGALRNSFTTPNPSPIYVSACSNRKPCGSNYNTLEALLSLDPPNLTRDLRNVMRGLAFRGSRPITFGRHGLKTPGPSGKETGDRCAK